MAVAPFRAGQALGYLIGNVTAPSTATVQTNAAANWYAVSFVPDSARTLSACRAFVSAIAGTLAGSDITCDLYDSTGTSGAPGAAIESGKVPTATITAAGWYDFTGFTSALVSGTLYWLVFKNVNAVPATNNCTFKAVTNSTVGPFSGTAVSRFNWSTASSTNSGGAWTTNANRIACRIGYSDGSYDGLTISNAAAAAVGDGVYATRESGVKFTSPANGVLKVAGIGMLLGTQSGTPTNGFRFGIWTGGTPANQGYTTVVPQNAQTTTQWIYSYFSSDITINPGTVVRVTLATSGADTSAKRYELFELTADTDSNSVILLPWNGTAAKTYYDGSSWTDSALGTSIFGHALLLDTAGEFGGGPIGQITGARSIGTY